MNKIFTIVKKELKRYFTDKRTLISLFLPGLLIFFIYTFMGNIMTSRFNEEDNHLYAVKTVNMPDEYNNMFNDFGKKVNVKNNEVTIDEGKELLKEDAIDLLVIFPVDFKDQINAGNKPEVNVFYTANLETSLNLFSYTIEKLSETALNIDIVYYINSDINTNYDLGIHEEGDSTKMFIQMMMPFLLVIFLFSGCMAISTEAIAGEKERGTIYTLLVTPTKRSEIAIGKILALSIVGLVSASVSFIGTIFSLPKLMGTDTSLALSMYGFGSYIAIFLIILVTVILFTSILLLMSAYAKSIKEASQLALVLMIPTMLVGVTSMLGANDHLWASFIPIYNSITTMSKIFGGNIDYLGFILTVITNLLIVGIVIYLLTKMFNSEKIMRSN